MSKGTKRVIVALVIVILVTLVGAGGTYLFLTWNAGEGNGNNARTTQASNANDDTGKVTGNVIYLNENETNGNLPAVANQNASPDSDNSVRGRDNANDTQGNLGTKGAEDGKQQGAATTTTTTEISGVSEQDTTNIANVTKDFAEAINGNMPDSVDYSKAKSFSDTILPRKNNLFRYSSTSEMTDSGIIMAQMEAAKQGEESGNVTVNLVSDNGSYKIMNVIAKGETATVSLKVATDSSTGKLLYLFPYAFVGNDGKAMTD